MNLPIPGPRRRGGRPLVNLIALACPIATSPADAQCPSHWLPGDGMPGMDGPIVALVVLPSGDLVAGGRFTTAGTSQVTNIARWDGSAWLPLGPGLGGDTGSIADSVGALAVLPNGDLVAGGYFITSGGTALSSIARWDGSAWSPLGSGVGPGSFQYGAVGALAVLPGGDLVAGGNFSAAGGVAASNIARWDGAAWHPLGAGVGSYGVSALTVMPNGDLIAGGGFYAAGGAPANHIARWDGSTWSPLGSGVDGGEVMDLAVLPGGDLLASGRFLTAGGGPVARIARWNGAAWSPVGPAIISGTYGGRVDTVTVLPNGDILAGGLFDSIGGVPAFNVARWNGAAWSPVGSGTSGQSRDYEPDVTAAAVLPSGETVVAGSFSSAGGLAANSIARWDGSSWSSLGTGASDFVRTQVLAPNGDLVAGGGFMSIGGVAANGVARWDGAAWSALGAGVNGYVYALAYLPDGDLVAGGYFDTAGGGPARNIARWDGSSWSPLGAGVNNLVQSLAVLPSGDLVAAGLFSAAGGAPANSIARWDGSTWFTLGAGIGLPGGAFPYVYALVVLPNGDLIAGGWFNRAGGNPTLDLARWDGSAWSPFGQPLSGDYVRTLTVLPGGDLLAGGLFTSIGGTPANMIARWNGAAWFAYGAGMNGEVNTAALLPGGDLFAGGRFTVADGLHARNIARWDGASWAPLAEGLSGAYQDGEVRTLIAPPSGGLAAGGFFTAIGTSVSAFWARWLPPDCDANCDCSTTAPILNAADFICFLSRFAAADPSANCDHSTQPPVLNVLDFSCFLNRFAAGCS